MKEKKGISLIVLIVTIIVMIIIAGAIIISLTETNVIDQAEVAVEKHNLSELKSASSLAYANWLLSDKTLDSQNYIRDELIRQKIATWDDFSKYYITETGGIEEIDQEAFIFIVDIKDVENDSVNLWVEIYDEAGLVNWGDGSEPEDAYYQHLHRYSKPGKYEVTVTGKLRYVDIAGVSGDGNVVTAIKSFGNLEYEQMYLWSTNNLKYISMPNPNSFKNLYDFSMSDSSIQKVPDYMFRESQITELTAIFNNCRNLKSIPEHLFDGLTITNAKMTFYNCTSLTGNAPELWNNTNITVYDGSFYNCTGLSNYNDIPDSWKQEVN